MLNRLSAAVWAAVLAGMIAKAAGVPFWADWNVGDQCDYALAAGALVWFTIGALRRG